VPLHVVNLKFSVKPLSKFKSAFAVLNSRLAVSKGGAFGRCPQASKSPVLRRAFLFFRFLFLSFAIEKRKKEQASDLGEEADRDVTISKR